MKKRIKRNKLKEKEKDIQKAILQYLHLKGIFAWVNKTQGTYDPIRKVFRRSTMTKGVADILGVVGNGKILALEVKSATGKLTPDQAYFLKAVEERGGVAAMVRSVREVEYVLSFVS